LWVGIKQKTMFNISTCSTFNLNCTLLFFPLEKEKDCWLAITSLLRALPRFQFALSRTQLQTHACFNNCSTNVSRESVMENQNFFLLLFFTVCILLFNFLGGSFQKRAEEMVMEIEIGVMKGKLIRIVCIHIYKILL
jgi:hypothetical protein